MKADDGPFHLAQAIRVQLYWVYWGKLGVNEIA